MALRAGAQRVANLADRQPAATAFGTWVAIYVGLLVWGHFDDHPILLARAEPGRRDDVYTMLSSSTASMLAVTLTVLAILYALPDRPAIREARDSSTWPALQGLLLSVALLCLIALVTAHIGLTVDHGKPGTEWLEFILITSVVVATLSLLIAGLVFAAVLYLASQPPDPSEGRGALAGKAE
jgi:hypothetical protein